MHLRSQRGSALLLSMIVTLALAIIGVATIRLASRELAGATAARQTDKLVACAEAGRQLLMSQFRAIGIGPTSVTPLNVSLGSASLVGGHVDAPTDTATIQVNQVKLLPAGTFATRGKPSDITNIIGGMGNLGSGAPYRVLVHCVDPGPDGTSRQLEVEFGVQFGI
jgi:hypothetical protein